MYRSTYHKYVCVVIYNVCLSVCLYVCMCVCVCVYVCLCNMYVCVYVCMYVSVCVWGGCVHRRMRRGAGGTAAPPPPAFGQLSFLGSGGPFLGQQQWWEGECFSIFRRADDVTRTMSKGGGGGACECPRAGVFSNFPEGG